MRGCVVFDLDDTLIDTTGLLVPDALRRVAQAAGVSVTALNARGKRIDEVLAPVGALSGERRAAAAREWYDPAVPELPLLPGARALLEALQGRVYLALLTRGDRARQQNKMDRCDLPRWFDECRIRKIEAPGSKRDDLLAILAHTGAAAAHCAVIGDDPQDELRHAAELGCLAIAVPATPFAQIPALLTAAGILAESSD